ncbi:MAG: ArsR family transcriptional regulator [Candidatus Thermoplasmatota archaeon]|nr:ArsR family transcriptional regulator [Candidatus Thermoplasmatota archaeon]
MIRTKVVNDSTDLIPLMRAFDTSVKQEVFKEIQSDWCPLSEIKEKYGSSGKKALELFDQMKLVETKWTTSEDGVGGKPQKTYRSYYSAFNINISCPVNEISEIFTIASLNEEEFKELEQEIQDFIGNNGKFGNSVAENFNLSKLALKSIVKRSNKMKYQGLKLIPTN